MSQYDDKPYDNEHYDNEPYDDAADDEDVFDTDIDTPPDTQAKARRLTARQRLEERRESRWLKEMTSDWDDSQQSP